MKLTVKLPDGNTVEVEHDAVALPEGAAFLAPGATPEGFIPQATHDAEVGRKVAEAVQERLKNHVARDKAAEDATVIQAVLAKHGGKTDNSALEAYAAQVRESEVKPLEARIEKLNGSLKSRAILAAAASFGFKDEYVKSIGGAPSYAEHVLSQFADFDPESGEVYWKENGQRVPGSAGTAYLPLSDGAKRLKEHDAFKALFKEPAAQGGADYKGGGQSGGAKTMARAQFDQMDPAGKAGFINEGGKVTD